MSILNNFFSKNNTQSEKYESNAIQWQELISIEQLDTIINESNDSLVGVFKHSTRCSISKTVLRQFEQDFSKDLPIKMYYLDLLNFRDISNEIAKKFQIPHQSPQLLLINSGIVIADASHYDIITQIDLQQFAK